MSSIPGFADELVIHHRTGSTANAEGRTTATYTDETVRHGRGAMLDFAAAEVASQNGQYESAVALVPLGYTVTLADEITLPATCGPYLEGRWPISAVRPNRHHTRVILRRTKPAA